jgi:ubiquinone biosynthesis protein
MPLDLHAALGDHPSAVLLRNRGRVEEILGVLGRYGLASWSGDAASGLRERITARVDPELRDLSDAQRLRLALQELGPTFVKLGQILSTRRDLVGEEMARELEGLREQVPADPPAVVRATVERGLGLPIEEAFGTFDLAPLASASIGQVHAATLHDGREVIVKVRHAGIAERMRTTFEILGALAQLAEERSDQARRMRVTGVVRELSRALQAEMDLRREADSLTLFRTEFADRPDIVIPEPFEAVSADEVLTMERLEGRTLQDAATAGEIPDPDALAANAAGVFLDMIFRIGTFHHDPHPGNIMLLTGGRIGILDFGGVGHMEEATQDRLARLMMALDGRDVSGVTTALLDIAVAPPGLDHGELRADVGDWVAAGGRGGASRRDLAETLEDLLAIARRHRLQLPPDLSLLVKAVIQLQGNAALLGVRLDLVELIRPYQAEFLRRRMDPDTIRRRLMRAGGEWERLAARLPDELQDLLDRLSSGTISGTVTVDGLDRTANRLAVTALTTALFTGSVRLWTQGVPPRTRGGVSIPGAAGTAIAGLVAASVLRAARRNGGLG